MNLFVLTSLHCTQKQLENRWDIIQISDNACIIPQESRAWVLTNHNHTVTIIQLLHGHGIMCHASQIHGLWFVKSKIFTG
jgi:hypothetical protein